MIEFTAGTAIGGNVDIWNLYVKDGLVAWWDGMWNAGMGVHNASTLTWKDLSGNNNDMTMQSGKMSWSSDSLSLSSASKPAGSIATLPLFVTMEIGFKNSASKSALFVEYKTNAQCVASYTNGDALFKSGGKRYAATFGKRNAWSIVYNSAATAIQNVYRNGVSQSALTTSDSWGQRSTSFQIGDTGSYPPAGEICYIRLYNRALTVDEITHNCAIDQSRFNIT